MEKKRIITISREFGSGGRTIGRKLADQLGIPCYDSELIERIAIGKGLAGQDSWKYQSEVIRDIVDRGSCVIVGRCADFILKDTVDCLTVFIHADLAFRADRIVRVYGERDTAPEQRVREMDKQRAAYHRRYTDQKWGQAKDYHVCLDSGVLGIDKCVEILSRLY